MIRQLHIITSRFIVDSDITKDKLIMSRKNHVYFHPLYPEIKIKFVNKKNNLVEIRSIAETNKFWTEDLELENKFLV